MNTGINLGSSLGTAVLGVILILGSFSGIGLVFNQQSESGQGQVTGVHNSLKIWKWKIQEILTKIRGM